ncbi:ATP-binding protein [Parvularcula lutaonensis]|uniref:histidine kinase n=2 Tax=Parvularcula lutaonensis TaxID=491923 RepID=A0ABV7M8M5_9PROT|nr:two-component sensor histidine kinase [Parvularcula lutaonensis]
MDVQANKDDVKPSAAEMRRKPRALGDLAVAAGVVFLALSLALVLGLVPLEGALLVGGITFVTLVIRYVVPRPGEMFQALTEEESEEVRRLQRYSMLLDSLPQPVMLLDGQDRIELANAACSRVFGQAIDGSHIASLIRAPSALGALREARHDNLAKEAEFTMAGGAQELSALFYVVPLDPEHSGTDGEMLIMVRDRTEQRKLERMRTDFIANAGHELRTPLTSILGFIETLQGHAKDDPDARERFLKIMQAQTERMLRLVKDLVSLSALELNERRLPEDVVDLREVAETVCEMMDPVAKNAGAEMVPGPLDGPARITGDRDQLIQVAQNLVDNALKYGERPDGTPTKVHVSVGRGPSLAFENADRSGDSPEQIAVRAGCRPDDLRFIRVRDEGPGIDRNDLPRVTERFYRIDVERSSAKKGTGLGLAIVKHIVGRHRGGIQIESAENRGAAFTCYFPPQVHSEAEAPAQD